MLNYEFILNESKHFKEATRAGFSVFINYVLFDQLQHKIKRYSSVENACINTRNNENEKLRKNWNRAENFDENSGYVFRDDDNGDVFYRSAQELCDDVVAYVLDELNNNVEYLRDNWDANQNLFTNSSRV